MPDARPVCIGTGHARNEGPGGCVPWEDYEKLRDELAEARMHLGILAPMLSETQSWRWRDQAAKFRAEAAAARIRTTPPGQQR